MTSDRRSTGSFRVEQKNAGQLFLVASPFYFAHHVLLVAVIYPSSLVLSFWEPSQIHHSRKQKWGKKKNQQAQSVRVISQSLSSVSVETLK